jgi:hypothetical protein
MTEKDVLRIQSQLEEMDIGLNEFFLGACKIHGAGTYKMARNQKMIIAILKEIMKKEEYEVKELLRIAGAGS